MRVFLLLTVTLAGALAVLVSGYFLRQDWAALSRAYAHFERLAASGADLRSLFVAEARQNVFRLNRFAEGVGVLLGAILAAIGPHGLCLLDGRTATSRDDRLTTRVDKPNRESYP
jgi:hypothetical protein